MKIAPCCPLAALFVGSVNERPRAADRKSAAEVIAEARAGADEHVGDLLRTCEGLRDFALTVGPAWRGRPIEGGPDRLVALMFARTNGTYWAIVELLRMAFGEQAAMLARSLLEDMVDMHYITVAPDAAVERLPKQHEHADMLMTDALKGQPARFLEGVDPLQTYEPQRREEFDKLFGRYGDVGWSGLNIHQRVAAIENLWEESGERDMLNFFRAVVQRAHNQTLHVSGSALASLIRSEDDHGLRLKFGPGPEHMPATAFAAFWIYSQAVRLILERFAFPRDTKSVFYDLYFRGLRTFNSYQATARE